MGLATVGPASPGARAQLLLGLLVCALFQGLCMSTPQSHTHAVTIDAVYGLRPDGSLGESEPPAWVEPAPLQPDRRVYEEPAPLIALGRPTHVVAIDAAGTLLFDGCAVDPAALRMRIDLAGQANDGALELRPDRDAAWEAVDTALATLARAHAGRFRFDNRPFAGAIYENQATARRGAAGRAPARRACPPEASVVVD